MLNSFKKSNLLLKILLCVFVLIFSFVYLTNSKRIYTWSAKSENNFIQKHNTFDEVYINALHLTKVKLSIHPLTLLQYDKIYEAVYSFDFESFQSKNKWSTAEISVNDTTYQVQIKLHGKTPYRHSVGAHKSLKIKSSSPILGFQRFNLILYERVNVNADRIKALGKHFRLYYQINELIELQINEQQPYLYYLESSINSKFLSQSGLFNLKLPHQKCPILNQNITLETLHLATQKKLKSKGLTAVKEKEITIAYTGLNETILNEDYKNIHLFFDLNYIARFQIARGLAGFINHGFTPENLIFGLDTSSYLFYPILHRDNYFDALDTTNFNSWTPYYHPTTKIFNFKILELITKNEHICNKVRAILSADSLDLVPLFDKFDAIDKKHQAILKPSGWISYPAFTPHQTRNNYAILKTFFN